MKHVSRPKESNSCNALVLAALVCIVSPCTAAIYIQASHDCVLAKGDPLFITGDGYHNGSAVIWGIGHSFFIHEIVDADSDGTLTWTWDEKVTEKFHSGPSQSSSKIPGKIGSSQSSRTILRGNLFSLLRTMYQSSPLMPPPWIYPLPWIWRTS